MNVTPKPASTALRTDSCSPSSSRTSRSRSRTPSRRSSSSTIRRTPAPSCMTTSVSLGELVRADRPAGEPVARRADEDDLVVRERLELHSTVARRGADDPELELPFGDEVDDGPRVVHLERDPHRRDARAGTRRGAAARRRPRGPSRRRCESTPVRSPSASETTSASTCSSSARSRWAPRYSRRPASVGSTRRPERSSSWRAEALLERPHLQRDGGLRDPEPLGRLRRTSDARPPRRTPRADAYP